MIRSLWSTEESKESKDSTALQTIGSVGSQLADNGSGVSRIVELEAELADEKKRSDQKEDELFAMQKLLAKLEAAIEQQAKDAQLEQDRIGLLEKSLSEKQGHDDQTVEKLLLAVAGEKKKSEAAEQTIEELMEQVSELETRLQEVEEALAESQASESTAKARLAAEEAKRKAAEELTLSKESELSTMRAGGASPGGHMMVQANGHGGSYSARSSPPSSARRSALDAGLRGSFSLQHADDVKQLQQQLEEQTMLRHVAEQKLSAMASGWNADKGITSNSQDDRQLALVKDAKEARELRLAHITQEREVVDLQRQLSEELSRMRSLHYNNIEKERLIIEKDRLIASLRESLQVERDRLGEPSYSHDGGSDHMSNHIGYDEHLDTTRWDRCSSDPAGYREMGPPVSSNSLASPPLGAPPGSSPYGQSRQSLPMEAPPRSVRHSAVQPTHPAQPGQQTTRFISFAQGQQVPPGMKVVQGVSSSNHPSMGEHAPAGSTAVGARPSNPPGQLADGTGQGMARQRAYVVPQYLNVQSSAHQDQGQGQASMIARRLAMASRTFTYEAGQAPGAREGARNLEPG